MGSIIMGKRSRFSAEEKSSAIEAYIRGEMGWMISNIYITSLIPKPVGTIEWE